MSHEQLQQKQAEKEKADQEKAIRAALKKERERRLKTTAETESLLKLLNDNPTQFKRMIDILKHSQDKDDQEHVSGKRRQSQIFSLLANEPLSFVADDPIMEESEDSLKTDSSESEKYISPDESETHSLTDGDESEMNDDNA